MPTPAEDLNLLLDWACARFPAACVKYPTFNVMKRRSIADFGRFNSWDEFDKPVVL